MDIWPQLTNGTPPARDALLLAGTRPDTAALRMGDWKILKNPGPAERAKAGDTYELYNLATDISESHDLAAAEPDRLRAMKERLESYMKSAVKSLGGVNADEDRARPGLLWA